MLTRAALCSLTLFSLSANSFAQTVDFNPPTEIEIVQGKLAITFTEAASEDEAQALLNGLGLEASEIAFAPAYLWAASDDSLTADEMAALEADSSVFSVAQQSREAERQRHRERLDGVTSEDVATEGLSVDDPNFTALSIPKHRISLEVDRTLSEERAEQILAQVDGLVIQRIEKRPSELVIDVPEDEDEAIVAALEASPIVEYVAYLAAN